jgi:hypothetical protein
VCVCVSIFRPAEHVLMARVLETPVEYRTPGELALGYLSRLIEIY